MHVLHSLWICTTCSLNRVCTVLQQHQPGQKTVLTVSADYLCSPRFREMTLGLRYKHAFCISPCAAISPRCFDASAELFVDLSHFLFCGIAFKLILPWRAFANTTCSQLACIRNSKQVHKIESTLSRYFLFCRGHEEFGRWPCITTACVLKHLRRTVRLMSLLSSTMPAAFTEVVRASPSEHIMRHRH